MGVPLVIIHRWLWCYRIGNRTAFAGHCIGRGGKNGGYWLCQYSIRYARLGALSAAIGGNASHAKVAILSGRREICSNIRATLSGPDTGSSPDSPSIRSGIIHGIDTKIFHIAAAYFGRAIDGGGRGGNWRYNDRTATRHTGPALVRGFYAYIPRFCTSGPTDDNTRRPLSACDDCACGYCPIIRTGIGYRSSCIGLGSTLAYISGSAHGCCGGYIDDRYGNGGEAARSRTAIGIGDGGDGIIGVGRGRYSDGMPVVDII